MSTILTERVAVSPMLKWAGGKRWIVPHLSADWARHSHRRLVEPFCGGMAVTLGLMPERAPVNDINPHLMNFYRWVQRGFTKPSIEMANDEAVYYAHRLWFNDLIRSGADDSPTAAWLFYYLNRTGFNGLCRFNSSGLFNVPFGKYKTITYRTEFSAEAEVLAAWEFACGPFQVLRVSPDDFIYIDPPYDVEFTTYSQGGFTWNDQVRTVEWAAAHPGPVILSNQATPRIVELYTRLGFELQYIDVRRRISCKGDDRATKAPEVIARRNI